MFVVLLLLQIDKIIQDVKYYRWQPFVRYFAYQINGSWINIILVSSRVLLSCNFQPQLIIV